MNAIKTILFLFAAGGLGGFTSGILVWALGTLGITPALGFSMVPELTFEWMLRRVFASGIMGRNFSDSDLSQFTCNKRFRAGHIAMAFKYPDSFSLQNGRWFFRVGFWKWNTCLDIVFRFYMGSNRNTALSQILPATEILVGQYERMKHC